jgi:hypothetical protein
MKRIITAIIIILTSAAICTGQGKDRRKSFKTWENYEITTEKVGVEGTKFVKVWGFGKTADKALMNAKRNAVHACIFRGLPANVNVNATPAILKDPNAYDAHAEYFDAFFEAGGPYLGYINMTTDGIPSGQDRRQVKGGYKVAIYVQVMFDNLKHKLEADGIAKKLNSGF